MARAGEHLFTFTQDFGMEAVWQQAEYLVKIYTEHAIIAGDQPQLIQGIRRRDGIGEDQETIA